MTTNEYHQPIGEALPDFSVGEPPHITLLKGNYCLLEPLSVEKHLDDLSDFYLEANAVIPDWTYLPIAPMKDKEELRALLTEQEASADPYFLTIVDKQTRKAVGTLSLMRIDPKNRVIEVGWVIYSPALQRTRMATEAQYLLAKYVFETLRYRRYEWKCDSLNAPSRRAAERLGFVYEGTFRQAVVYKGRSRDTAWFTMIDKEWTDNKCILEQWLCPENFDSQGKQQKSLKKLRELISKRIDESIVKPYILNNSE